MELGVFRKIGSSSKLFNCFNANVCRNAHLLYNASLVSVYYCKRIFCTYFCDTTGDLKVLVRLIECGVEVEPSMQQLGAGGGR